MVWQDAQHLLLLLGCIQLIVDGDQIVEFLDNPSSQITNFAGLQHQFTDQRCQVINLLQTQCTLQQRRRIGVFHA
ncbi:hypothetical protein D3C87_2024780 [compost metagenome]